ncbi:MAG: hypothetical protein Q8P18_34190 [Pseudomonadota bacterium]|nr:hypothetical protein [Pseudomonadota bacterium]
MLLVLSLLACSNSQVPEDAIFYNVTVTAGNIDDDALVDECHPEATEGSVEEFVYAVAFEGSAATLYIGEDVFALGTITGCDLTYSTVTIGEETEQDGVVKWQLFGTAAIDSIADGACVEGDGSWAGSEYFEIVNSEDETLEPGCQYEMRTEGTLASSDA